MRRRRSEADHNRAEIPCRNALHGLRCSLGQLKDAPRVRQERHPRGRQRHRSRRAVDELHAEFVLELLDLPTERRLCHMQTLGGPPEVQFLRDGDEAGQPGE